MNFWDLHGASRKNKLDTEKKKRTIYLQKFSSNVGKNSVFPMRKEKSYKTTFT